MQVIESPARQPPAGASVPDYSDAEEQFANLITLEDLDERVAARPAVAAAFERALANALEDAYGPYSSADADAARLFTQRALYRVNRLKLFWYDDLSGYENERSAYLRGVRDRVEAAWQAWEFAELDASRVDEGEPVNDEGEPVDDEGEPVSDALRRRAAADVAPAPSADGLYFRERVGEAGYRRLLAIASLDGLVEASQLSRTLGGASNGVHAVMTKLLVEEYGGGRLARKHSSFFTRMLEELRMSTEPEFYFDCVPWEVLAAINHSFLLSERKRFYLRYVGGLLYTEVSVPAAFESYRAAAERLGLSEAARGYWELHIHEDERHGRWMLEDVALPLAALYPKHARELVLGYDQQRFMSARAGAAVTRAARGADAGAARASTSRGAAA
jgi:Iron-containing redox enzyme